MLAVGWERLTLEAVARQLGVSHSSLYKHVRNREELVAVAVEHVVTQLPPPALTADSLSLLEGEGWAMWNMLEEQPGLALEMSVQSVPPPAADARADQVVAALVGAGYSGDDALLATDLVYDLAFDVALRSHHLRIHHPEPEGFQPPREWFQKKLNVVLAGVAEVLAPRP